MSRRPDYNYFPNPKVTVIVNERPGSSTTKRGFNNSSISASNSNGTGVEIEMPRKWPTRKAHAKMINRDKRIELGGNFERQIPREQRIVEKVQTQNRVFQPLGLIRKISADSAETKQPTRPGRKPIEAPSLSDIKINQRPVKPRFAAASGKADRLIELAPIDQASSSTAPLVLPRPTKVAQEVKAQSQKELIVTVPGGRIKRSLLNPILPPGKERPKEIKVTVEQREEKKLDSPPVKELAEQVTVNSQPKSNPKEESVPIVILKEVEESVKERVTVSPVKEEGTPSKDIVEPSTVPYVPADSPVQSEEMLRVFPPKQTYDPDKMTAADREIMQKDILRTRKRRRSPVSSRSSSPKVSPRKRHEANDHKRHDQDSSKIKSHPEAKKVDRELKDTEKKDNSIKKAAINLRSTSPKALPYKRHETNDHKRLERTISKNSLHSEARKLDKGPKDSNNKEVFTVKTTINSRSTSPKVSPRKRNEPSGPKGLERRSSKLSFHVEASKPENEIKQTERKENSIEKTTTVVSPLAASNASDGRQSHTSRVTVISFVDEPSYILSNKYPTPGLRVRENSFTCPFHYCSWRKAKFCNNLETASKILESTNIKEMDEYASGLKCDEKEWLELSWKYVVEANYEKYQQFEAARLHLFQNLDAKIAEANPIETYWSCGLDIKDKNISDFRKWTGENVMGKVLMEVRDLLAKKVEYAEEVQKVKKSLANNKKHGHIKENGK